MVQEELLEAIRGRDEQTVQMLRDRISDDTLSYVTTYCLINHSIYDPYVSHIMQLFRLEFVPEDFESLLEFRFEYRPGYDRVVVHPLSEIISFVRRFDNFHILAFQKLVRERFYEEEAHERLVLMNEIWNRLDSNEIQDKLDDIIRTVVNVSDPRQDYVVIDFMIAKGYREHIMNHIEQIMEIDPNAYQNVFGYLLSLDDLQEVPIESSGSQDVRFI